MLEHATTHASTTAILAWLLRARKTVVTPDPVDGSIPLDYGPTYRIVLIVFVLLATAMLTGIGVVFWGDAPALSISVGIFGAMWLAFLYGTYDAFCVTMKASSRGLESKSPLTGHRVLPWESITRVPYGSTGNWYRFKSEWGWSIRVSIYRNGLRSFSALVSANIGRSPARMTPSSFYAHTT